MACQGENPLKILAQIKLFWMGGGWIGDNFSRASENQTPENTG